jgi:hypothetical protein
LQRENIQDSEFDENTVYCISYVVDTQRKYFVAVFATEESVLNLHRQQYTGQPMLLAIDASYRYTTQRNVGLFPCLTVNQSQEGRVLAYGYSNHETQETYQYIFEALKRESTRVLKDRFATGRPVYL